MDEVSQPFTASPVSSPSLAMARAAQVRSRQSYRLPGYAGSLASLVRGGFGGGAKGEDGTGLADVPTIFEVFERLGLKMEAQKGVADVYVIGHVEKPSEN
jgi:hypothetical protein